MNIPQNTYYNQQPMMTPQPRMPIRQRMEKGVQRMQNVFPKWLSQYPIAVYILTLALVNFMYSEFSLPWYYMLSGLVAVLAFFLFGVSATKNLAIDRIRKEKTFEKKIFILAFVPRLIWMILIYIIFMNTYGDPFGFENRDTLFYDDLGKALAESIEKGNFGAAVEANLNVIDVSDIGYAIYVGFVYWLTGNSIIVVRIIKCLLGALTVLLMYRLAKRNFGEQIGRNTAIFVALWPNFWYYCAVHLKETEMVFLGVLFVEQADQMLRSRQFTAWKVVPVLLIAAAIFTMRTPLGVVAILALIFSVVMSSSRVVNWGKRIIVGGLAIALIGVVAGNRLEEKARGLIEASKSNQEQGIEWYSTRKDKSGNQQSFAKYAGTAVFAPMIFTLPFPSMVRPFEGQEVQQLLNGGNYTKNILSGFTIFAMVMLLISGKWREHLLPLSFMLGYLVVLALSSFAHSERFHQPAMPFEFMFAAYGLSIAVTQKKYKRWFTYWCALMFVAAIAWNWFKIAGRGLS